MTSYKTTLIGIVTAILLSGCGIGSPKQFVPADYTVTTNTGGSIEAEYLLKGSFDVSKIEAAVNEDFKSVIIYYPSSLTGQNRKFPVVVFVNGTGVKASNYVALFEHLASWGFIVVGNEERESWDGDASEKSLAYLLSEDENPGSVFYGKVDRDNIGASGHSQGGAGVFTTITEHAHSPLYKTAVSLSPTHEEQAAALKWHYDLSGIHIPILLLAGTRGDFETKFVIPFEKMVSMYKKIPSQKAMARRAGAEHGEMLYSADGYVTAWLMWQLQSDEHAAEAFIGKNPEILSNGLYQDQKLNL